MEKKEFVSLDKVKTKGNLVKIVLFKPRLAVVICLAVGVALGIFVPYLLGKILGLFFAMMALAVLFLIPEHKVLDIYDEGMIVYNSKNSEQAFWLDYEDVASWKIEHTDGHDFLEFVLADGSKTGVDTFQVDSAYKVLDKYMHDKEYHVIQAKKNKEKPLVLPEWVRKRFENESSEDEPSSKD